MKKDANLGGRPKLARAATPGRSPVITARVPEHLVEALERARKRRGDSRSEAIRVALELYCASRA